jgi:hypothetical protein
MYAQLYYYDAETATNHRINRDNTRRLDRTTLLDLHHMLLEHNHFAAEYKTATERLHRIKQPQVSQL